MTIDTADHAALLRNQELSDKESLDSGDDFFTEINTRSDGRPPWLPSRSVLLAHVGVLLLYTIAFLAALTHVLSFRMGKADVPLSREDLRGMACVVSRFSRHVLTCRQLHQCGMPSGTMSGPSGTTSRTSIPSKESPCPRLMKSGHIFSMEVGLTNSFSLGSFASLVSSHSIRPFPSEGLTLEAHEVRVSEEQMRQSNLSSIRLADGSEDFMVQPIVSFIY